MLGTCTGRCCIIKVGYHATVNTKIKILPLYCFQNSTFWSSYSTGKGSGGGGRSGRRETATSEYGILGNGVGGVGNISNVVTGTSAHNNESGESGDNVESSSEIKGGILLALSPTLWVEPDASAAGVRTASLLNHFANIGSSSSGSGSDNSNGQSQSSSLFKSVHYGCGLKKLKMKTSTGGGGTEGETRTEKKTKTDLNTKPTSTNANSGKIIIPKHHIPPNRSNEVKSFLQSDEMVDLDVVMFDRFFAEEVYSFHLYNNRPNVVRILDMQDMHSLRHHRQRIVEEYQRGVTVDKSKNDNNRSEKDMLQLQSLSPFSLSAELIERVMSSHPTLETKTNDGNNNDNDDSTSNTRLNKNSQQKNQTNNSTSTLLLRELASIHRSDLTLVCSPHELTLLRDEYGVPPHKLTLAPFFIDEIKDTYFSSSSSLSSSKPQDDFSFNGRSDFVTLGGFKHPPNIDQVKVLKYDIWPKIRNEIPHANLHIYGSYMPQSVSQLHDEKSGFLVKGYANDLAQVLASCRVMLSPLRFGAGIKGKVIDSWKYGCPVVTTPVGAEGLSSLSHDDKSEDWGGTIASNTTDFVKDAVNLYFDRDRWEACQNNGRKLLESLFDAERMFRLLENDLKEAMDNRYERRQRDYFSASLWHQQSRSTEYFSRWIELKETTTT